MKKKADIPEIVNRYIQRRDLFQSGGKILAAVSGGADSLCLLLILKELGYPLHVAHFDHGLRPGSGGDAETVRRAAEKLGIPFLLGQGDVCGHAARNRLSLEEAARDLRYDFLFHAGQDSKASAVATGHTMNDQAETVLMHLVRGTGLRGLGGMRPDAQFPGKRGEAAREGEIRIVRPLLCLTHSQTVEFCRKAGWAPLEDPSNQDPAFARNKIRLELIPLLEKYNESVVDGLSRLADLAQAQEEYIDRAAEDLWNRSACELGPGLTRIPQAVFRDSPTALQQALVRRAIRAVAGDLSDLAFRHVAQVMGFLESPTASRRMDLALGVEVSLENDWLVFRSPSKIPANPEWEAWQLPIPGSLFIHFPNWTFEVFEEAATLIPSPEAAQDPWTVWIDPNRIRLPLALRKRRTGDSFIPLGMPGPVKVNDFLASHHLSLSERDHWPLVCDADGIIWIPGFRLKAGISPSDPCLRRIRIHVEKTP